MKIIIVFESMFGNTERVAEELHSVLAPNHEVDRFDVNAIDPGWISASDVLIAGAPTHVHGLSRPATRAEAAVWSRDPRKHFTLRPQAAGIGMREWLDQLKELPRSGGLASAFDTRAEGPKLLTGAASSHIARSLRAHGRDLVGEPGSFLVTGHAQLLPGERSRVREWAKDLDLALQTSVADRA